MRLKHVCLLLVLSAYLPASGSIAGASPPQRLNVVFILADDLGWADLACYGADLHQTPHLDRLAAQSVRFTQAYAAAPVCTPTRASILTGKHPARLHMTIWREAARTPPQNRKLVPPVVEENLPHQQATLAKVLKSAGYATGHVGKWHLGDATCYPETHGFDLNIGGTLWGAPATYFFPYCGRFENAGDFRYVPGLGLGKPGDYLTDRLTEEALRFIESSKDRPFYLNFWHHTVHTPIEGKPEVVERFNGKLQPGLRHQNAAYAAMVASLDESVGQILAKLDQLGLSQRTLLVFTSDNGGFIGDYRGQRVTVNDPLRSGKGSLYEGGVRVPLMVRCPGLTSPAECRVPVTSCDFYPTILEILGLPGDAKHNADLDGVSFVPLLKNPQASLARDTLYWHYPHYYATTTPVSAIRVGDWKLLEYQESNQVELYNLAQDLGEKNDLAAQLPEKAAELRGKLHAWCQSVGAQMPQPNPKYSPGKPPAKGKKKGSQQP